MQEAFYTNSYPADKNANSGHINILRLFSVGVAGFDVYVIYTLISHLYEYVTTIHREPDEILILCSVYALGLILKAMVATYGYYFATQHTERTPENYGYLFKFLHITGAYILGAAFTLYKFKEFHIQKFNMRFAAVPQIGALSMETQYAMHQVYQIVIFQNVLFAIYYFAWRSLYKKELAQPKIVDIHAANIKYYGYKTAAAMQASK
jgi:hypothetical protein